MIDSMTSISEHGMSGRGGVIGRLHRAALYVILSALAVVFMFPFYWPAISAFKSQAQIFSIPPEWVPIPPRFSNFTDLYRETNLFRAFLNSVIVAVGHVGLALFLCSLAGYAFAKLRSAPGSGTLFAFVIGTMMIPGAVTLIPLFIVLARLHMINTYSAMILPGAASAFGIFWMRQYMGANVPDDLVAAARIDGCGEFEIYRRIA